MKKTIEVGDKVRFKKKYHFLPKEIKIDQEYTVKKVTPYTPFEFSIPTGERTGKTGRPTQIVEFSEIPGKFSAELLF